MFLVCLCSTMFLSKCYSSRLDLYCRTWSICELCMLIWRLTLDKGQNHSLYETEMINIALLVLCVGAVAQLVDGWRGRDVCAAPSAVAATPTCPTWGSTCGWFTARSPSHVRSAPAHSRLNCTCVVIPSASTRCARMCPPIEVSCPLDFPSPKMLSFKWKKICWKNRPVIWKLWKTVMTIWPMAVRIWTVTFPPSLSTLDLKSERSNLHPCLFSRLFSFQLQSRLRLYNGSDMLTGVKIALKMFTSTCAQFEMSRFKLHCEIYDIFNTENVTWYIYFT